MMQELKRLEADYIVYMLLLLFTAIISMIRYKRLTPAFKVTAILMPITFVDETVAKVLARTVHNNLICSHILRLFEFTLVSLTYYHFLEDERIKKVIRVLIPVYCFFVILNAVYIQRGKFASNSILIGLIAFIVYAILSYKQLILTSEEKSLTMQPIFWNSTAWLLFGSTVFLKFGLQNYFVAHHINQDILYDLLTYMNILLYSLILVAILIDKNEKRRFGYQ
ncbi:hypothetical protein MUY27_18700 [Mucilaginibacter sp. RS28]|uniref:Uncharacterized protein n=1 Tax=Mucilaginibacter straminoryzae TaxID=2932774 RepID=A0A9X2BBH3_9SPHI|nr:hypothetical protein [Mucilaginibacter straminoryzae]MCJ8211755.1 hypothetical protein [Mucilaginibacter straminoryzae]